MRELAFAVPGDLAAPTGGYEYARRLLEHLPGQRIVARHVALPASFPSPSVADIGAVAEAFAALPRHVPLMIDGLAYGALPGEVIAVAAPRPILALVHHPLGMEEGLEPRRAAELIASERSALALATRVVVTSGYTARLLAESFGLAPELIHVAPPGTEPAERTRPTVPQGEGYRRKGGAGSPTFASTGFPPGAVAEVRLLAVGAVTPRKGYDLLIRALAADAVPPWHLTIAGALDRAAEHVRAVRDVIARSGLDPHVTLAGAVSADALDRLYRNADVLVSASLFEGYGMALAEGLARGLPIVMARAGAANETVPDAAALKVAPGDVDGLAAALRLAVAEPSLRASLSDAAWTAGRSLPRWKDTAAAVAAAVLAASS